MKTTKLSSLLALNNEPVETPNAEKSEQVKELYVGDTKGGNDATGGPPDWDDFPDFIDLTAKSSAVLPDM